MKFLFFLLLFSINSFAEDDFFKDDTTIEDQKQIFYDPIQPFNRASFQVMKITNTIIISPITKIYDILTPKALQPHLRSVANNANTPLSAINALTIPQKPTAFWLFSHFFFDTFFGFAGFFNMHEQYSAPVPVLNISDIAQYYYPKTLPYLLLPMAFGNAFVTAEFYEKVIYNDFSSQNGNTGLFTTLNFASFLTSAHANRNIINSTLNNSLDAYPILRDIYYTNQKQKIEDIKSINFRFSKYSTLISEDFRF